MGYENVDLMHLDQFRIQWRADVNNMTARFLLKRNIWLTDQVLSSHEGSPCS